MDEEPQIKHSIVKCSECGSRDLIRDEDKGELWCQGCGLVLAENEIDQGAEWRVFGNDGNTDRARTGAPLTERLHDRGLSTDIDWQNKDYAGKAISSRNRSQLYRMRKWQKRARTSNSRERNLSKALPEINRICVKLGIPNSLVEEASMIYRRSVEADMVRGRSIDALVASAIYAVCCRNKLGRTLEEICAESPVGRKELTRTYKLMKQKLKLRMDVNRPQDYVESFCSKLGLPSNVNARVYKIIEDATELELVDGKSPTGVTAAAIYIACHLERHIRTQLEISTVSHVTEVTIRNRYKELIGALGIEIDN